MVNIFHSNRNSLKIIVFVRIIQSKIPKLYPFHYNCVFIEAVLPKIFPKDIF